MSATKDRHELFCEAFEKLFGRQPIGLGGRRIYFCPDLEVKGEDVVHDVVLAWIGRIGEVLIKTEAVILVPESNVFVKQFLIQGQYDYDSGEMALRVCAEMNDAEVEGIIV